MSQKIYYAPGNENWEKDIPEDSDELLNTVYLIGDIKYPGHESESLQLLKNHISKAGKQSAVVVLGDILYPLGLRDSADTRFNEDVENLKYILNTFDNYEGEVVFMPGNHDWAKGRREGWENVKNQELFIEQYLDRGNVFLPDGGCPGPVEIQLSQDIVLIIFDTQWYFHQNDKPGIDSDCDFSSSADLLMQLKDAIRRNRDKKIILASHHPIYSVGKHGGYYPASYLLFPLLDVKKWMYLPLPGFLYTGYRKYLGNIQDLAHPEYKILKGAVMDIVSDYPNVIYATGHEHNLQYFGKDSLHHIVSGGGGEATYIARRQKKTDFAIQSTGFTKLSFYANGNVWMAFISPDSSSMGDIVYTRKLFNKPVFDPELKAAGIEKLDFSDSVVQVKLSDLYNKRGFQTFLMGDNYRDVWNAKVELPVFDIESEKGGLSTLKRGGGMQTRSLRLEDKNGKQYVLRSVNKYVEKALASNMQNTFAVDIVQDGISASHPFSSITIPKLADAAGVMHTNPKIVWIPDDPRLGIYQEEMANSICLFEERPADNRDDIESLGRSENIVNTGKVIKETQDKHNHRVDQKSVVRARLFDVLINDWDRHDDQWRWASFKNKNLTIYQPIPRDRDQAFFVNEGVAMGLVTQVYPLRKFQGFDYEIKDINGLTFNGRWFDRSFMTEPDLKDWMSITKDIQSNISDDVIHEAINSLPDNIYDLSGKEIENKLQARRDLLHEYAKDFYRFLSKTVDVVGTNDRELFDVNRLENGNTEVNVYEMSDKKGKIKEKLYSREFKHDETKEIRLYGLKGKDSFEVVGYGKKGIKVRIIGGRGKDYISDESKVRGLGKNTVVYDRKDKENEIIKSNETRLQLSNKKSVNEYDRKQFKHNTLMPLLQVGYNIDDGVFIGGGVNIKRYNFRDSTFHKITGNLAIRTAAFAVSYNGLFTSLSQKFDLMVDADISYPRNVDNFFGLGNETEKLTNDKRFYRVRYSYAWLNPSLKQVFGNKFSYSFGAFYQYFHVTDTADKFIGEIYPELMDSTAYIPHHYTGLILRGQVDTRDRILLPRRGVLWDTDIMGFYSIREDGKNFVKLRTDLRFFLSFRKDPRVTFAFRFGGAANIGDYEFFHANYLGLQTNLRGYRSNRFAGDYSFYQNTEIRFKLLNIRSHVFNGQTGLLLFNDIGRVWVSGEDSNKWHDGWGIGAWLTPFDFTALTLTYSRSTEDRLVTFAFRFLF
jgi:hypothetical protein